MDAQTILILTFICSCFCSLWLIYLSWEINEKNMEIKKILTRIDRSISDYDDYCGEDWD